jgi:hypothetical protein
MVYEMRGQLEEAMNRWVESWRLAGRMTPEEITFMVNFYHLILGFADVGDTLRGAEAYAYFASGLADSVLGPDIAVVGLYAAHSGQWRDLDRLVRVANEGALRVERASDSIAGRRYRETARVLTALLAEHRTKAGAANAHLERASIVYPGPVESPGVTTGPLLRFELVRRYLASGNFPAAQRQLDSFYAWEWIPSTLNSVLELRRGQVAEGLGKLEEAKMHYANLVRWWKDCDPEARPVLEEARAGLVRLTGEPVAVTR